MTNFVKVENIQSLTGLPAFFSILSIILFADSFFLAFAETSFSVMRDVASMNISVLGGVSFLVLFGVFFSLICRGFLSVYDHILILMGQLHIPEQGEHRF